MFADLGLKSPVEHVECLLCHIEPEDNLLSKISKPSDNIFMSLLLLLINFYIITLDLWHLKLLELINDNFIIINYITINLRIEY